MIVFVHVNICVGDNVCTDLACVCVSMCVCVCVCVGKGESCHGPHSLSLKCCCWGLSSSVQTVAASCQRTAHPPDLFLSDVGEVWSFFVSYIDVVESIYSFYKELGCQILSVNVYLHAVFFSAPLRATMVLYHCQSAK